MKKILVFALVFVALIGFSLYQISALRTLEQQCADLDRSVAILESQQAILRGQLAKIDEALEEKNRPPEPEKKSFLREIPLSQELQKFTFERCADFGVDYDLMLSLMWEESRFQNIISENGKDYGLCQINAVNHRWLAEKHGLSNMMEERQNITAALIILSSLAEDFPAPETMLMAYNMGASGARKRVAMGIYSSAYSEKILKGVSENGKRTI